VSGGGREALQMRFHFGERDRAGDAPLDVTVMDACARHGVWAAALLRGVEGFGAKHLERTDRLLSLSEDAPLVAVAVGEGERVEALAAEVRAVAGGGLLTVEGVEAIDGAGDAGVVESSGDAAGDVVRATIWGPRTGPRSPHLRVVDALWRHGAESATVLLGVDGVLAGERRRARFVSSNRGVPAITVAVGERGAIVAALAEVEGLANLMTLEAGAEGVGGAEGTRVALVTLESAPGDGRPLYLEFIHALRSGGARGATALRGVWGFRGKVAPHGDRVLALRRDVPVIVETVDSAEAAEKWLGIAESLAGDSDIVYSLRIRRR
jgi:PII-like signaling protein